MPVVVIEAVTFDYWNTLCHESGGTYLRDRRLHNVAAVLDADGVTPPDSELAAAYDAMWHRFNLHWEANDRQFTGAVAAHDLCDRLGDLAPPGSTRRTALVDAFLAATDGMELRLVDGVGDALAALDERGIRIGIICDVGLTPSPVLRAQLEAHGLLHHFDHWSFSDEVGTFKPDRRIFEHALAGLGGVAPDRAAHIGDRRRTDVAGALAMGMRAVRLTAVFDDEDDEQGPSGEVLGAYDDLLVTLGLP